MPQRAGRILDRPRILRQGIQLRGIHVEGIAGTVFRLNPKTLARDIVLEDIDAFHCGWIFKAMNGTAQAIGPQFRRIRSQDCNSGGILLRGPCDGAVLENIAIECTTPNTDPGNVPAGIALAGKSPTDIGNGVTIRNAYLTGIKSQHDRFLNGDGVATERGYSSITISRVHSTDNSDGGFDIKSQKTRMEWLVAERNQRNFKLWYDQTDIGALFSVDPGGVGSGVPAHVACMGSATAPTTKVIEFLSARSKNQTALFNAEVGPVNIVVKAYDLQLPPGTPLLTMNEAAKGSAVDWGPQGKPKV